jgi:Ca-activated chloride channel homolog
MIRSLITSVAAVALFANTPAFAQDVQDEEQESFQDIIVTGSSMRVRQGGQQDIKHFRSVAMDAGMPRPEGLSVEGLMGEHDLSLPSPKGCAQLFCLVTESMPAALPLRPDDRLFVGLGFSSNVDAASWKREPLNMMAVVDKSGSMSGEPLSLVRASLRKILDQMTDKDRFGITLYGDMSHVYLAPTDVRGNRERIAAAIDAIQSAGSTNMEAGLRVGYDTAFADAPGFKGKTRMMLFTDEQPNTGRTDAQGFMTMAEEASRRGIGLTTIGVGVQFGDALAAKVSSVRGGNLFFVANRDDVKTTFEKQLDTMVSEIAHDVTMVMSPAAGMKITGVFGVPANVLETAPDGAVSIRVPTAFLSTNGGGIFVSLGKDSGREFLPPATLGENAPLMTVSLSYIAATNGQAGEDRLAIAQPSASPSTPLRTAHLLVDQFLTMRDATTAFHMNGDPKAAHALLSGLDARLTGAGLAGMEDERKLTSTMLAQAALMAGYGGELPKNLRHIRTVGTWEVIGLGNIKDLKRGDRLEFRNTGELLTFRQKTGFDDAAEQESYEINDRQLHMTGSRLVFDYRLNEDRMTLDTADDGMPSRIVLRRVPVS